MSIISDCSASRSDCGHSLLQDALQGASDEDLDLDQAAARASRYVPAGRTSCGTFVGRGVETNESVTAWHALPVDEVLRALSSGPDGLSEAEAGQRLARHGANRLPAAKPRSPLLRLLAQFNNVLI
jgi:magnesium-transporting ATPase (P-type)